MPLQYKIEYRMDDLVDSKGRKMVKKRPAPSTSSKAHSTERTAEKAAEQNHTPRPDPASIFKGRTSADALDKVTLPAGYCVYYTRGAGVPVTQADPHGGKVIKHGHKVLGVVDPNTNTHQIVQEEYAIIREVVEMYLEKQVSGEGTEANKYRVGGQLENNKEILERLAVSMSPDQEPPDTTVVPYEPQEASLDTDSAAGDTSRSLQAGKTSRRCLLPISKALQIDNTPRGPFVVEGQGARGKDTGREDDPDENKGAGKALRALPVAEMEERSRESLMTVSRAPLTSRDEDKQQVNLERGFDVIRNVFQKYPDPNAEQATQGKGKSTSTVVHHFIPYRNVPLEVVSRRSTIGARSKRDPRDEAGLTPVETTKSLYTDLFESVNAPPPSLQPDSPAFQLSRKRGKGRRSRHEHWKPVLSTRGLQDADPTPRTISKAARIKEEDGQESYVHTTPSKVILNVVLPREDKSREGRLCGRNISSAGSMNTGAQQPLTAWLARAPSPPPPPPPTAPAEDEKENLDGDDQQHFFLPNVTDDDDDEGCEADDDSVATKSRDGATSARSTGRKLRVSHTRAAASPGLSVSSMGESDEGLHAQGAREERKVVIRMPMTPACDGEFDDMITQVMLASAGSVQSRATSASAQSMASSATNTATTTQREDAAPPPDTPGTRANPATTSQREYPVPSSDTPGPPANTAEPQVTSQRALKVQKQTNKKQQQQKQVEQHLQQQQQYTQQKVQKDRQQHERDQRQHKHLQHKQEAEQRLAQKQAEAQQRQQQEAHQRLQQHHQEYQQRLQQAPTTSGLSPHTLQEAHCDVLGPHLCKDCETARHRKQFTARQDMLYPHIDVYPRSLIATQRLKGKYLPKGDHSSSPGRVWSRMAPRWPYMALGDLSDVVTDLDLCKRIVDKGHRAKLPTSLK
ncbi:uncharacterized protein [Littorina saxatilis]|uniref:Uncharacterized protein n=1 Tax=Littorina saxatilis TaxID=31220 RepID=A0AAN9BLJ4_9CAEN